MPRLTNAMASALGAALAGNGFVVGDFDGMNPTLAEWSDGNPCPGSKTRKASE